MTATAYSPVPGVIGFDLVTLLDLDPPERWSPTDPGEGVQGIIRDVATVKARGGRSVPQIDIETSAGRRVRLHCSPIVLFNEVSALDLRPGDILAVRFNGELTSQSSGRVYKSFTVRSRLMGR